MSIEQAIAACKSLIIAGSKSFSLAARLFDPKTRDAAFCLYGWCRYCDDQIDDSRLGMRNDTPSPLVGEGTPVEQRLKTLFAMTKAAYAGEKMLNPVFIAFQHAVHRYSIPDHYPLELLEGMAMDVRRERYQTMNDLLLYCYRVAGTVGLMMSHIMGLSSEKALKHASDMGSAMQLTNIARDVLDDAAMGRVYIPLDWLREEGVPPEEVHDRRHRRKVAHLVKRLLAKAEELYASGDKGLIYLPFQASCAIQAARHVYSEIGRRVLEKREKAWDERTVVPLLKKLWVMGIGLLKSLFSLPDRLRTPWKPISINSLWRFQ